MLEIHPHHLQILRPHAERTYPEECCGLLLGTRSRDRKILIDVIPTENSWNQEAAQSFEEISGSKQREESKNRNFSIAPEEMLRVQKEARDRALDIIGIYHSHPDSPAIPSEFDRAIAWSTYSYLIISVPQGQAKELLSWTLDDDRQFQPEALQLLDC